MKKLLSGLIVLLLTAGMAVSQDGIKKEYPFEIGHLRLKANYITYHQIKHTQVVTDTLKIYNDWDYPMEIDFLRPPAYLKCRVVPSTLPPKTGGLLIVTMDAPKRNDYGFLYDRLTMVTNDSMNKHKAISVSVNITEDFSSLSPKEKENAPDIVFNTTKYNFGKVKTGDVVRYSFVFSNKGENDLVIRKTRASCGCTATKPEKKILKKGESSKINISFNTKGRKGRQHKTVNVISNDPKESNITLHIEGTITE